MENTKEKNHVEVIYLDNTDMQVMMTDPKSATVYDIEATLNPIVPEYYTKYIAADVVKVLIQKAYNQGCNETALEYEADLRYFF